ncbi:MAG: methionine biosynthesis protein MetW [Patescibacteria group bacterium]
MANFFPYFSKHIRYIFSNRDFVLHETQFDETWSRHINNEQNPRFVAVASVIEPNSTVLDLGCGNGDLMKRLISQLNVQAFGIDASTVGIERCRALGLQATYMDLHDLDLSQFNNFDYIVLSEVIEHIVDCEKIIEKVKGHFNKALIVTIPNAGYIWYRLRYLFGRFPIDEDCALNMHVRFWTKKDFTIWSKQMGLKLIAARGCGGFPKLWRYWPSLFSRNNLYVMQLDKDQAA